MSSSTIAMLVVMVLYMAFVICIGFYFSKKNSSSGDFYLGGRKLGPLVTAMSAEASDMSSYLLMGLPGLAYLTGICDVFWTITGLAIGTYLNWLIVSRRLRNYSYICGDSITVPDFFSNRYGGNRLIRALAALIIIIFFVPYTASGFAACGKLFVTLFNANYIAAMIISALVIVIYTTLGGFLAASTSDFIQSIIMTIALLVVIVFAVSSVGGIANVISSTGSLSGYLNFNASYDAASGTSSEYGFITILSTLAWGLGYFGMPHILLRFMAIKDDSKLKLSRRVASVWVVISMAMALIIGITGMAMSQAGVIESLSDSETVIIAIAMKLSESGLFYALIAGIILAGILASTMSTSDSQLLAASSSVSEDILVGALKLKLSEKQRLLIARSVVLIVAVIGIFIARDPDSNVFNIVSFAWAGFGAAFGPLMLFSLFWRRCNKYGAIAGIVSGGAMVFIWKFLIRPLGGILDIYELLPAFITASIFIVVVSLLTPEPDKEIVDEFDSVDKLMKEKKTA